MSLVSAPITPAHGLKSQRRIDDTLEPSGDGWICCDSNRLRPGPHGLWAFLPEFRETFVLSTTLAGLIASAGFFAFLAALPLTALLVPRFGPKPPVVLGALSATAGFATLAAAPDAMWLSLGIILAGASAGLCWAPFNEAADRIVSPDARSGVLSVIATGTSLGVGVAAGLSLAVIYGVIALPGAWLMFALAGVITALGALAAVPGIRINSARHGELVKAGGLLCRKAAPLYTAALCFGATNAIYLSFAADRVVAAGGLSGLPDAAAAPVVFLAYGTCGMLGLLTGRIEAKVGLGWLLKAIFAAAALSLVLIALIPTSWAGVLISSGIHGAALMSVSAVFSFWSLRLFPGRGTLGFTAALVGVAVGSVLGPAVAGLLADGFGPLVTFTLAVIPALLIAFWPKAWPETWQRR